MTTDATGAAGFLDSMRASRVEEPVVDTKIETTTPETVETIETPETPEAEAATEQPEA